RRLDRLDVNPAAGDHPCDHGVRVPHLIRAELVTAPHRRRHVRYHFEQAPSQLLLIAEARGAVDGLGDVRYVATAPDPDLVAEDPKSACPASADGALGDDAALLSAPVVDRRLLDHERPLRE